MSARMHALVLHAIGDARYEEVQRPEPGPGEALVRVGFCGVCGSDLPRVFVKGTYSFPTVCGHELAGVVERTGEGVTRFAPGDRVAVFPLIWCGRCASCESGDYVQCSSYDYLGSRSDGGFAEYVVAPAANLLPVPEGVSLEVAAMTEPAAVALHALERAGSTRPGEVVVVFGVGPIGLMVAQWARAMGASRILLFDVVEEKIALARRLGFPDAWNSRAVAPLDKVLELTGGNGAHVSIDGAGVPATLLAALEATRRGGRVVLLGNPSADVTVPAPLLSQLMRREVQVAGTWNSRYSVHADDDDWRTTLDAMARKALDLEPLISHRVALHDAFGALDMMRRGDEFYAKVLIRP